MSRHSFNVTEVLTDNHLVRGQFVQGKGWLICTRETNHGSWVVVNEYLHIPNYKDAYKFIGELEGVTTRRARARSEIAAANVQIGHVKKTIEHTEWDKEELANEVHRPEVG